MGYRAPEVLLRSHQYNSPIDIWACGGIMAEIYNLRPLFPGSSESDQLYKTCLVLGTPTKENGLWPEGVRLAAQLNYRFPTSVATPLRQLMPHANEEAINVLDGMLQWDPNKRLSTVRILAHPYFEAGNVSHASPNGPITATTHGDGTSSAHTRAPAQSAQASGGLAFNATGGKVPSAGKDYTLPAVPQDSRRGNAGSGGGRAQKETQQKARYLQQMARYQPGVESTPTSQMHMPAVRQISNGSRDASLSAIGAPRSKFF